jgi:hypothetical protein
MIGEKNIVRVYGVLFAIFAPPATLILYRIWRNMPAWLAALILIVFLVVFYRVGVLYGNRPAEVRKNVPISSQELRRRRKRFYDWLASQGRR